MRMRVLQRRDRFLFPVGRKPCHRVDGGRVVPVSVPNGFHRNRLGREHIGQHVQQDPDEHRPLPERFAGVWIPTRYADLVVKGGGERRRRCGLPGCARPATKVNAILRDTLETHATHTDWTRDASAPVPIGTCTGKKQKYPFVDPPVRSRMQKYPTGFSDKPLTPTQSLFTKAAKVKRTVPTSHTTVSFALSVAIGELSTRLRGRHTSRPIETAGVSE